MEGPNIPKIPKIKSELIYEFIKGIRDPEKDRNLEELGIVEEDSIEVHLKNSYQLIKVSWRPTSPNCSLASIIGLSIRKKIEEELKLFMNNLKRKINYKVEILVVKGSHLTEEEINKQLNDKERYLAALENPDIINLIDKLISY
jgi:metal-sulfur cluster biosynthetic enzyme